MRQTSSQRLVAILMLLAVLLASHACYRVAFQWRAELLGPGLRSNPALHTP